MAITTPTQQRAGDMTALFSTDYPWVKSAIYNGAAVSLQLEGGEELDRDRRVSGLEVEARVRVSEVTQPVYRASVVLDGDTYRVFDWQKSEDLLTWRLTMRRDERPEL